MSEHIPIYDIGAAVVGTGFIGPVHAEALKRLGVRVVGIAGSTPDKGDAARRALGLAKGYRSFDEILNDADVDVVHVATPNVHHYPMARAALEAGKHVMCEKPLAMTSKESGALVALAASKDLAAGVCYNLRFYPLNLEARARVEAGEIGRVMAVNGSYVQDWLLYDTDYNWRVLAESGGALRAVADIGTHWLDLTRSITGLNVESVFADLATFHKTRKRPTGEVETFTGKKAAAAATEEIEVSTDDYGAILLRMENGARGTLHVSQVTAGRKNRLEYQISGSEGAFAWNSDTPNELWVGKRDEANQSLTKDPALLGDFARPYAGYPGGHNEGYPDCFKQCFRSFYEAISSGSPKSGVYPTFSDGHEEILLCEAILESHRTQKWVDVR